MTLVETLLALILVVVSLILAYARKLNSLVQNPPPIPTMDFFPQPEVTENTKLTKKQKKKSELTMWDDDEIEEYDNDQGDTESFLHPTKK